MKVKIVKFDESDYREQMEIFLLNNHRQPSNDEMDQILINRALAQSPGYRYHDRKITNEPFTLRVELVPVISINY